MPSALRTRRRVREPRTWPSLVAALTVHGAIFGAVNVLGLSIIGSGNHSAAATRELPPEEDVDLKASCSDNVIFAASGRMALCLAPWVGSVDDCLNDAQLSLWIDRSSCQARNDPGTAVTLVEPKALEQVKQIDAEKLLEEMRQQPKPKPEPPPPAFKPPEPPAAAKPPPPPPPPPQQLQQQVVETVKPKEEKEPENARFLSEYNTSVDKQKVSRGARNEAMVAKSQQAELTPKDKPKDEPSIQKKDRDRQIGKDEKAPDVAGRLSMRNPGALFPAETEQEAKKRGSVGSSAKVASADGYEARKGDGAVEQERRERSEIPRGQAGAGGGVPDVPNLKPSEQVLERVLGGGSVDRLDDVENGDETALSSKRWVYASFFNRLKRQVAQVWDPNSVWRRADPTGSRYGTKTRTTEVRVSLSPKGDLVKILVVMPSGSVELDEEGLRAFRAAGPFPNPPEGLVQKDNLITFAFGFTFELGAQQHLTWRLPQAM
ncbi:MAG TPA: TonB family protein [Kofleriaceae bacterium]|jgi:TonB family protein|nr:TonB family protein [Kofleriaceae bacterium]